MNGFTKFNIKIKRRSLKRKGCEQDDRKQEKASESERFK